MNGLAPEPPPALRLRRRTRAVSVVVGVVLLGAVSLLALRAVASVRGEQALRHQLVAERIFDGMEAALSELIQREEGRPFLHYRHYYLPEGQLTPEGGPPTDPALNPSPLARVPRDAFLLGYFQYGPDGRFVTPHRPYEDEPHGAQIPSDPTIEKLETALRRRTGFLEPEPSGVADTASLDAAADAPPASRGTHANADRAAADKRRARPPHDGGTQDAPGAPSPLRAPPAERAPELALAAAPKADSEGALRRDEELLRLEERSREGKRRAAEVRQQKRSYRELNEALNVGAQKRKERAEVVYQAAQTQVENFSKGWSLEQTQAADDGGTGVALELRIEDLDEAAVDASGEDPTQLRQVVVELQRQVEVEAPDFAAEPAAEPIQVPTLNAEAAVAGAVASGAGPSAKQQEVVPDTPEAADKAEVARPVEAAELADAHRSSGNRSGLEPAPTKLPVRPPADAAVRVPAPLAALAGRPEARTANQRSPATPWERASVDVVLSPLAADEDGRGGLVLHREVRIGQGRWVQGFVLDTAELSRWLQQRVLADSDLEDVARVAWNGESLPQGGEHPHRYEHRFAPPFAQLRAAVALPNLPGPFAQTERAVLFMTGLVALLLLAGLVAVDRMITSAVLVAQQRSDFVAAVTHELKSPLTAIRMHSEMLEGGMVANEDRRQEYFRTIRSEAERLSRLVNDVLLFARIERGQGPLRGAVGSLGSCVDQVSEMLAPTARRRGMRIEVDLDEEARAVTVDSDAMIQVLTNLLENALKFAAGSEPPAVTLRARRSEAGELELRIRDHGPGVVPEVLPRIFDPFVRGERELVRKSRGTGIGLALVRALVADLEGRIEASNHPEGGLEVRVAIPAPPQAPGRS
jgi:signal transduction histidine kinase